MAESGVLDSFKVEKLSLRGFAECKLCNKPFRAPKLLPCLHTFCLACLEQWVKNSTADTLIYRENPRAGRVQCPTCAHPFNASGEDDLQNLKDNLLARRLAHLRVMSEGESEGEGGSEGGISECSACVVEEGGEKQSAEMFCIDCADRLCVACAKMHLQFRLTRSHKILPISELASGLVRGASASEQPSYCEQHSTELVTYFCSQCSEAVCAKCLLSLHKSHQYLEVEEAASQALQELDLELSGLGDHVTKHEAVIGQGEEKREELLTELSEAEREIERKCEELKRLVERYRGGMMKVLDDVKTRKGSELEEYVTEAKHSIERMITVREFSAILKEKGTQAELATLSTMLRDRARTLSSIPAPQVTFLAEVSIDTSRKSSVSGSVLDDTMDNLLGKLTMLERSGGLEEGMDAADLYLAPPKCLGTVAGETFVHGVAVVDQLMYVVRDRADQVEVFKLDTLEQHSFIQVEGLQEPVGMAASVKHKLLYITGRSDQAIYVVSTQGDGAVKKWSLHYRPKGVSVSGDERLWVTCQEERIVVELSSDGASLRDIQLSEEMTAPWLTVSCEDRLLVCHGNPESANHRLSELSLSGEVLRSYTGGETDGDVALNMPNYIAIDNNGYIILLDYNTSCVRLINPRLAFRRYLLSSADQGLSGPTCMWLDADKGLLCVGQFDGKVHVYRIIKDLIVKLQLNSWD